MSDPIPVISNPKRKSNKSGHWYDYYAGYSPDFVTDVIKRVLGDKTGGLIVDPWNGSGTTTAVATHLGYRALGVDLNPALVVIATARQLSTGVLKSLSPLTEELIDLAGSFPTRTSADSLNWWFGDTSSARIRAIERSIQRLLVDGHVTSGEQVVVDTSKLSTLAAFFYNALFLVARDLTVSFRSTNPTWIRRSKAEDRIGYHTRTIDRAFRDSVVRLASRLAADNDSQDLASIVLGSADSVGPMEAELVLGSPPYCTRIDYVIATLPELAVLGYADAEIKTLRKTMLGTPTIQSDQAFDSSAWGPTAKKFARIVKSHDSYASSSYYHPYYNQYFAGLSVAINNLVNVMTTEGTLGLVVQDSYFKELHLDLAKVVVEMGANLGYSSEVIGFPVARTFASIHPGVRNYRNKFNATESLVLLRKAG